MVAMVRISTRPGNVGYGIQSGSATASFLRPSLSTHPQLEQQDAERCYAASSFARRRLRGCSFTTISTSLPSKTRNLTRRSSEKPESLPRLSAETFGWSTSRTSAASARQFLSLDEFRDLVGQFRPRCRFFWPCISEIREDVAASDDIVLTVSESRLQRTTVVSLSTTGRIWKVERLLGTLYVCGYRPVCQGYQAGAECLRFHEIKI